MYYLIEVQDIVRVSPNRFDENLDEVLIQTARSKFEGEVYPGLGLILCVNSVRPISRGRIIPGDGGVHYDCIFSILTYTPENNELVVGEVVDLADYGAFIRVGPIDALLHVSQISSDEQFSYSERNHQLAGRKTQRLIKPGDRVRGRVNSASLGKTEIRVGLNTRYKWLGLYSWVEDARASLVFDS